MYLVMNNTRMTSKTLGTFYTSLNTPMIFCNVHYTWLTKPSTRFEYIAFWFIWKYLYVIQKRLCNTCLDWGFQDLLAHGNARSAKVMHMCCLGPNKKLVTKVPFTRDYECHWHYLPSHFGAQPQIEHIFLAQFII